MMQRYHIWMNIFLAVTSEMKIPSKAMTFHLIRLDIPTARCRRRRKLSNLFFFLQ